VHVWDATTGAHVAALPGHGGYPARVAFSPDGTLLATTSFEVRLWDTTTWTVRAALAGGAGGPFNGVAFSPDGAHLAGWNDGDAAFLWSTGEPTAQVRLAGGGGKVTGAAFSPDSTLVATACDAGIARVWTASEGKLLASVDGLSAGAPRADGSSVAFGGAGGTLLVVAGTEAVKTWKLDALLPLTIHATDWLVAPALTHDGRYLFAAGGEGTLVRTFDAHSGRRVSTVPGDAKRPWAAAWGPDGKRLVTADPSENAARRGSSRSGRSAAAPP